MEVAVTVILIASLFQAGAAHRAFVRRIFLHPAHALFQRPVFADTQLGILLGRVHDEEMVLMCASALKVADFLRAMQSLGFSVGDVIVLLQSFNESKEEIKHADSGM